ncbi:hypothetical protein ABPG74_019031 [Tetrahymena malaccensis]
MQTQQSQKPNKEDIKKFFIGKKCIIPSKSVESSFQFLQTYGYNQIQLIDAGAFGLVMKAIDSQNNNRIVAIKLMIVTDSELLKKSIQEYQKCLLINHPHVVKNFQQLYDEDNECYFIISEFCQKGNLFNYYQQNKINYGDIIQYTLQILEGLKGIHDKNIIHSDLKPQNILIKDDGSIKICDLGLSKYLVGSKSTTSAKGGSLDYMAPEQLEGMLSKQCDVYSVGCIICFLCNINVFGINTVQVKKGIFPFVQNNEFEELVRIAFKMMQVEPKNRIQILDSIQELKKLQKNTLNDQIGELAEYKIVQYTDGRKYEGYLQNEMRNGKGKIYFNQTSPYKMYQGDWLNDKIEGFGIFEFKNGDIYEGNFINNYFKGKGICFYNENSIYKKYEGEWNDNKYEGYGILELKSGDRYEGNFKSGLKQGKGKYFYEESSQFKQYSGEFSDDKMEGYGIFEWRNGDICEGYLKNNYFNGKGVKRFNENSPYQLYTGDFVNDRMEGYGVFEYRNGDKYEGYLKNNNFNGQGVYHFNENSIFKKYNGEWVNDKIEGYGILNYRDGDRYEGNFKNNQRVGKGQHFYNEKSIKKIYKGDYNDNKMEGYGILQWRNCDICEGNLKNNYFNGKAVFYFNSGSKFKKYTGDFVKSKMDGFGILEYRSGKIFKGYFKNGLIKNK